MQKMKKLTKLKLKSNDLSLKNYLFYQINVYKAERRFD